MTTNVKESYQCFEVLFYTSIFSKTTSYLDHILSSAFRNPWCTTSCIICTVLNWYSQNYVLMSIFVSILITNYLVCFLYHTIWPPILFFTGKLACEGKVENKFDMKPHRENLMDYGKLCRERMNMSMDKPRKTEVAPVSVLFMKCSYWIDPFCCHTL